MAGKKWRIISEIFEGGDELHFSESFRKEINKMAIM